MTTKLRSIAVLICFIYLTGVKYNNCEWKRGEEYIININITKKMKYYCYLRRLVRFLYIIL